ncbi:MAG: phage holin [Anaerovoracaceae bacterium]|jgi:SPP1 family holin
MPEGIRISTGTIIRTVILILALANQILVMMGKSPIPIGDEEIETLLSTLATLGASIIAWWKNNSFTEAAIRGDLVMRDWKKNGR